MKRLPLACLLAALAVALPLLLAATRPPQPSHFLFVWAMESRYPHAAMEMKPGVRSPQGLGRDFLAEFNVAPGAKSFGKLVAMLPVGQASMAHHTSYALPPDGHLFANDWLGNQTYVFDLHNPLRPRLLRQFGSVGNFSYPHSFIPLPDGNTLATFQYSGGFNHATGGLVEFAPDGHVVRTASAAVAGFPNIRPYSLAVVPALDRVVSSSADMMGAQPSRVAQVWRLSDLKLLKTMVLPGSDPRTLPNAADSSEPRVLADGRTVVVPGFYCGLYRVDGLAGNNPTLRAIYDPGYRFCEVPVVEGQYLVWNTQSGHAILSIDMHDPAHPHEVSRILLPPGDDPHWIAAEPGGDRLVITGYGAMETEVLFAAINRRTGQLRLLPYKLNFTRRWPDGWTGSAIPHGAVFSN